MVGLIPATQDSSPLFHRFASSTLGESTLRRFSLTTPGGAALQLETSGNCQAPSLVFSSKYLNFGDFDCSRDPARVYARAMNRSKGRDPAFKLLRIDNPSPIKVHYHFVNADSLFGVFTFDKPSGSIQPHSYTLVNIHFGPLAPINYYKRFYCVFKNGPYRVVPLDLLGTGYNEENLRIANNSPPPKVAHPHPVHPPTLYPRIVCPPLNRGSLSVRRKQDYYSQTGLPDPSERGGLL